MDRETAGLVRGDRPFRVVAGLDRDRGLLDGKNLTDQRALHHLKLDEYALGGEGEGANGCRFCAGERRQIRAVGGVVGELRKFRVTSSSIVAASTSGGI